MAEQKTAQAHLTITDITDGVNANIWTTSTAPTTPNYTFTISNLTGSTDKPRVGDIILQGVYRYTITSVSSTTVLAGSRQSLQGASGAAGGKWYTGTGITGTSTTATIFSGSGVSSAVVGDMYLNTSTDNVYRCTVAGAASAAKWIYTGNIKGSQGDQGKSVTKVETEYYRRLSGGAAPIASSTGSTTIPDYVDGCTYYTRTITYFNTGDPDKSSWVENTGLTNENKNAYDAWIAAGNAELKVAKVVNDSSGVTVASGINGAAITEGTLSTYGYNTIMAPNYLGLRYNAINLAKLTTTETTPALEFYTPTVNGSGVPVQGTKSLSINGTILTFYRPGTTNKSIELDSSALKFYDTNENMVASYGDKIVLGKKTSSASTFSRAEFEFNSMALYGKNSSSPYFQVMDARDENGVASIVESFFIDTTTEGYDSTQNTIITLNYAIKTIVAVYVDDNDITTVSAYGQISDSDYRVEFSRGLFTESSHIIRIEYTTEDQVLSMTFGTRSNSFIGPHSVSEGMWNISSGSCSHAEGNHTSALAMCSHAEGFLTEARGDYSHTEGVGTYATGNASHAEGVDTHAIGYNSHTEGSSTYATKDYSHAEGVDTYASGYSSHTEGFHTYTAGHSSHAQNYYTVATRNYQTVIGKFNKATRIGGTGSSSDPYIYSDSTDAAFIIGGGSDTENRRDIFSVDWNGAIKITEQTPVIIETISDDNLTINVNSNYTWTKTSLSKTGYTLAGIVGFSIANATSGGANSSLCNPYYCQVTSASSFTMYIRNVGSASSASANSTGNAKVKLTVNLLWISNGLI